MRPSIGQWADDVRAIAVALHGDVARDGSVSLAQQREGAEAATRTTKAKPGRWVWVAQSYCGGRATAETADGAMSALLDKLRAALAENVRKRREELARLDQANAQAIRALS